MINVLTSRCLCQITSELSPFSFGQQLCVIGVMAFKFETANERWEDYKRSDNQFGYSGEWDKNLESQKAPSFQSMAQVIQSRIDGLLTDEEAIQKLEYEIAKIKGMKPYDGLGIG